MTKTTCQQRKLCVSKFLENVVNGGDYGNQEDVDAFLERSSGRTREHAGGSRWNTSE